jgi:hypothetical protein
MSYQFLWGGTPSIEPKNVDGKRLGPFGKDSLGPNHHIMDMDPPVGSPCIVDNINPNVNGNLRFCWFLF